MGVAISRQCGGEEDTVNFESVFHESPEIGRLFPELHPALSKQAAVIEANRCLNCFDAPCTLACPTHIDVPRFIKKISSGNLRGSALGILEANVLASSCARVCPVEVLCEGSCVMHHQGQQPIAIGRLQRHAMDAFDAAGGKLPRRIPQQNFGKVACLGAGPASLAAAAELQSSGCQVTIFDKRALPGGLNTYGVAEYKLSATDSLREIGRIAELGVDFRFGFEIKDASQLSKLEREFDVIFVGIGLGAMHKLPIPGGDHPSVVDALAFIEDYKLGVRTSVGGRVIVIGAGNTAVDAAVAAKRLGATEVRIIYRRGKEHISAFEFEYQHALQEGVLFDWHTMPVEVHSIDGRTQSLECIRVHSNPDGTLQPIKGSNIRVACDLIIAAIGQAPLLELLSLCSGVQLENGRVKIERATGQTTNARYFAGGDCTNGGREVVDAVADGKRAGIAIAKLFGSAHAG
jgi:dihydropyrimidine dehydrogenase (NAD+) subunit PreT